MCSRRGIALLLAATSVGLHADPFFPFPVLESTHVLVGANAELELAHKIHHAGCELI
jgi:hypothetical protein